jgi:putative transposase
MPASWSRSVPGTQCEGAIGVGQVFRQLYYHVVWATKTREPQVSQQLRPALFEAIEDKLRRLGCVLHALNALQDHVHVALEIPPARAVSSVVGQMKGVSAHAINQLRPGSICWQDGYGVLTFRRSELDAVKQYVATQEERYRSGTLSPLMETWEVSEEA